MPHAFSLALRGFLSALTSVALASALTAASAPSGSLLWETKPGARDLGPPVEASGIVVVGNINSAGGLFAFSSDTGKPLWTKRGEHAVGRLASDGQHLFAILGNPGRRMVSLDLKTGRQLWSVPGGDKFGGDDGGVIANGGRLYVMSRDGKVNAFAADTGKQLWEFLYSPVGDPECHSILTLSNGRLFFGGGMFDRATAGKFLWAIDAGTGKEVWRYESHIVKGGSSDCPSTPVVSGDTVAFTTANAVVGVRASTGKALWSHLVTVLSGGYPKALNLSEPALGAGVVFAAHSDALLSWSVDDGRPLDELRAQLGDPQVFRMSTYEETLYFFGDLPADAGTPGKHFLHAMDIASRKILWTHRTNRPVRYFEEWRSSYAVPTASGVYYDSANLFAKAAR